MGVSLALIALLLMLVAFYESQLETDRKAERSIDRTAAAVWTGVLVSGALFTWGLVAAAQAVAGWLA